MGGISLGGASFELTANSAALITEMAKAEAASKKSVEAISKQTGILEKDVQRLANIYIREEKKRADASAAATLKIIRSYNDSADAADKAAAKTVKAGKTAESSFLGAAKGAAGFGLALVGISSAADIASRAIAGIISSTRELEQAQFSVNALYGQAAPLVTANAEALAKATGRSKTEALQAAAAVANLGRQYAFTSDQQEKVLKISADLAAVKGISLQEATQRVSDALRGEAEAVEYLGQVLNADAVKAFGNMTAEQRKNFDSLSQITKAQLVYQKLLKDTADIQGASAKRIDTLGGSLDKAAASFDKLATTIGTKFIPSVKTAAELTSGLVDGLTGLIDRVDTEKIKAIGASILTIASPLLLIKSLLTGDDTLARGLIGLLQVQGTVPNVRPGAIRPGAAPAEESGGAPEQTAAATVQAIEDAKRRAIQAAEAAKDAARSSAEAAIKSAEESLESALRAIEREKDAKTAWYSEERDRIEARRTYMLEDIEQRRDAALAAIKAEQSAAKDATELAIELAERRRDAELEAVDEAYEQLQKAVEGRREELEAQRTLEDRATDDRRREADRELADSRRREDEETDNRRRGLNDRRREEDRDRAERRQKEDAERQQRRQNQDRNRSDSRQDEDRSLEAEYERQRGLIEAAHEARLKTIDAETDAIRQQYAEEDRLREEAYEQTLAAIAAEERAARDAHDQQMRALDAEAQAARDAHDEQVRALEEQSRIENDRHRRAIQALEDEKDARLAAIDAELGLLDAADDAEQRAEQDRNLADNVTNAELGVKRAQSTGNYSEILKAEQDLAEAQRAIRQESSRRERDSARAALLDRKRAIDEEIDARRRAEDEANRIRENEIRAAREAADAILEAQLRAIGVQRDAADGGLQAYLRVLADRTAAVKQAYEDEREAAKLLLDERLAEIDVRKRAEQEAYEQARKRIDDEYEASRQRLEDERRDEDRHREDRRAKEDRDVAERRDRQDKRREDERKKEDQAEREADARRARKRQLDDEGLEELRRAEDRERQDRRKEEDKFLAEQLAKGEATRETERRLVESHYDGPNGIITNLKKAGEAADKEYSRQLAVAAKKYEDERKAAERRFTNPEKDGLLDLLDKARAKEIKDLDDSKRRWEDWAKSVKKSQKDALDKLAGSGPGSGGGGSGGGGGGPGPNPPPTVTPTPGPGLGSPTGGGVNVDPGRFNTSFGFLQRYSNPFNPRIPRHRGVDLVIAGARNGGKGLPVGAFRDGTVTAVTIDPNGGNGVTIRHGDGLYGRYFHFDEINARRGTNVKRGDQIGILGESGTEGSPHLHYEIARNGSVGDYEDEGRPLINPVPYMNAYDRGHLFTEPTLTMGMYSGSRGVMAERGPERLLGRVDTMRMGAAPEAMRFSDPAGPHAMLSDGPRSAVVDLRGAVIYDGEKFKRKVVEALRSSNSFGQVRLVTR